MVCEMRKKIVRWLLVNMFLNPLIPDSKPVGKPNPWYMDFYWIVEITKTVGSYVCLHIKILCIFNILEEVGELYWSVKVWLGWNGLTVKRSLASSFQRPGEGGPLSFQLCILCFVFVLFLLKRRSSLCKVLFKRNLDYLYLILINSYGKKNQP